MIFILSLYCSLHIEKERQGNERVNRGWCFEEKPKKRFWSLQKHMIYVLQICLLKKEDVHIITYKSEGNKSEVDYLLIKMEIWKQC